MYIYVCINKCIYIYIYLYLYLYLSISICILISIHLSVCLSVYLCICPDSSVDFRVWTEFSSLLKSHSSQLSIATSKNPSVSIWQSCDSMYNFSIKINVVTCWFSCTFLVTSCKKSTFKGCIRKKGTSTDNVGGWGGGAGGLEDRCPLCPPCSRGPKIDHVIVIWPIERKEKWQRNRNV